MFDNRYRSNLAIFLIPLLLSACAGFQTTKIGLAGTENWNSRGVLFSLSLYQNRKISRRESQAQVLNVDSKEAPCSFCVPPPFELSAGSTHEVTIQTKINDSFLCFVGCNPFERSIVSVTLHVEAGHGYLPLAYTTCGKDWVWIIDQGEFTEDELREWRGRRGQQVFDMRNKDLTGFKVVAGEAPPDKCDSR